MAARILPVWLALVTATGCVGDGKTLPLVAGDPFAPPTEFKSGPAPHVTNAPPATAAAANRVALVGQKLLLANRQSGLHPAFRTAGLPTPEIFHRGLDEIFVTEGLVGQCKSDAQLAALLALEMGKMLVERELRAGPNARRPERLPPMQSGVGTGISSAFGPEDGMHAYEMYKYEQEQRRPKVPVLPDPQGVARTYLSKAGYSPRDLDEAAPLIKAARANVKLERQIVGGGDPIQPAPK
jgi:hypothetical protein